MRPSLLPGLLAAARAQHRARRRERAPVRGRPALSRRHRAADARPRPRRAARARHWRGKARPFDAFDAKAEALAILAAAGAPVDNLQVLGGASAVYHPGPVRAALPRPQEGPRRVRRAPSAHRQGLRPRRTGGRRRNLSRRLPPKRGARAYAQRLCAAAAPGGEARLRLPGPAEPRRRPTAARGARRRQGGDHRRQPVRRLHRRRACPRARNRSRSKSRSSPPRRASPTRN